MPGSKRRALKKLLSPSSGPSDPSPSLSASASPSASASVPNPTAPLSGSISNGNGLPPPAIPLTEDQIQEDLVLETMAEREKEIGHAKSPNGLMTTNSDSLSSPPPPAIANNGVPPPPPPPAAAQQSSAGVGGAMGGMYGNGNGGMGGGGMYGGGNGFGVGNGGGKKKKSSRQKFEERQARKQEALLNSAPPSDPNWTAQLEKERQEEIQVIGNACEVLGREIYEIAPDGHCMYSAIADQLGQIGVIPLPESTNYQVTRRSAANFMLSHPDDFMPFLPSITGEDSAGATDDGIMTEAGFKKYCQLVAETGEWGGEPEIQALSRAFNVPIHVIQSGPPTVVAHGGASDAFGGAMTPEQSAAAGDKVVRISYHKRMYGLGEFKSGSIV
ncbi:OTU domain-containing protein 6B [Kwoniella heveanensis CBS 569]|nr:OTU domain-containing protein 6B [Kwoniella heveanensis CBS 569]